MITKSYFISKNEDMVAFDKNTMKVFLHHMFMDGYKADIDEYGWYSVGPFVLGSGARDFNNGTFEYAKKYCKRLSYNSEYPNKEVVIEIEEPENFDEFAYESEFIRSNNRRYAVGW